MAIFLVYGHRLGFPQESSCLAKETADEGTRAGTRPADTYNAASSPSLGVPVVAELDKLDATQRKEVAQFYAETAMKLLREAVNKGYKDVAHMKKDTDLHPLRQRDDFQKLVAELEEKGK
jgi:hypothetical protein